VQTLLRAVSEQAVRSGQGYQLVFCDYARSVVELGRGRYHKAYASLAGRISDTSQLKFALVDQVEAASRCGKAEEAHMLVEQLRELAAAAPVPGTLGDLARATAILATDSADAEALYLEAIEHHMRTRGPARRARSHQLYGEWLRRERRSTEARHQLRIAYALFDAMGARGYAERTAQELAAAGDSVLPRPDADHESTLTAQEARVAHLAGSGATNAEIAAQLFLSTHTVDFHLRKVFRKLGIRSRRELAAHPDHPGR
jgi:DNA-binding CsgD family transcriptional regulator